MFIGKNLGNSRQFFLFFLFRVTHEIFWESVAIEIIFVEKFRLILFLHVRKKKFAVFFMAPFADCGHQFVDSLVSVIMEFENCSRVKAEP